MPDYKPTAPKVATDHANPEDYRREAVRLLERARNRYGDFEPLHSEQETNLAAAHIYATLAVAGQIADVAASIDRSIRTATDTHATKEEPCGGSSVSS
ncbi:MAG: hypothetical protein GEU83_20815 [Pseudonocardiaceae bacterium]|nr:hypothetical protein [Pseudonocardiaceae bacterium]